MDIEYSVWYSPKAQWAPPMPKGAASLTNHLKPEVKTAVGRPGSDKGQIIVHEEDERGKEHFWQQRVRQRTDVLTLN